MSSDLVCPRAQYYSCSLYYHCNSSKVFRKGRCYWQRYQHNTNQNQLPLSPPLTFHKDTALLSLKALSSMLHSAAPEVSVSSSADMGGEGPEPKMVFLRKRFFSCADSTHFSKHRILSSRDRALPSKVICTSTCGTVQLNKQKDVTEEHVVPALALPFCSCPALRVLPKVSISQVLVLFQPWIELR